MVLRVPLLLTALLAAYTGAVPVHACLGAEAGGGGWSVAGGHAHQGSCRRASAHAGCTGACGRAHDSSAADPATPAPSAPGEPKHDLCCADVPLQGGVPFAVVSLVSPAVAVASLPDVAVAERPAVLPDRVDPAASPPGVRGVVLLR